MTGKYCGHQILDQIGICGCQLLKSGEIRIETNTTQCPHNFYDTESGYQTWATLALGRVLLSLRQPCSSNSELSNTLA